MRTNIFHRSFPVWSVICLQIFALGMQVQAVEVGGKNSTRSPMIIETEGAGQVCEQVRAQAAGVVTQLFVKVGEEVKKGQILGSLDYDQPKMQYELAKTTYESKAAMRQAKAQAEAWTAQRKEIEESYRKRKVEKTKLDWAVGMESMYQEMYTVQKDLKKAQEIQMNYTKDQYEKRFFKAPCDGVVSEVLTDLGKSVTIASHLFTLKNDNVYRVPFYLSDDSVAGVEEGDMVAVRPVGSTQVTKAEIDRIEVDTVNSKRMISLFVPVKNLPLSVQKSPKGVKFEVAMPRSS